MKAPFPKPKRRYRLVIELQADTEELLRKLMEEKFAKALSKPFSAMGHMGFMPWGEYTVTPTENKKMTPETFRRIDRARNQAMRDPNRMPSPIDAAPVVLTDEERKIAGWKS